MNDSEIRDLVSQTRRRILYDVEDRLFEGSAGDEPFPEQPEGRARIAILASMRSGNSYLRMLLARVLDASEQQISHPGDVPWGELPERIVIVLHHVRTELLATRLRRHGFHSVTLIRHPFDVLLSHLMFAQTAPKADSSRHDTEALLDADPTSDAFARWAKNHGRGSLGITQSWLDDPDAAQVRYASLMTEPEKVVRDLLGRWSLTEAQEIGAVIELLSPDNVNEMSGMQHARAASRESNWQSFLSADLAAELRSLLADYLERLGVSGEGGCHDSPEVIRKRWAEIAPRPDQGWDEGAILGQVRVVDVPTSAPATSVVHMLVKVQNDGQVHWPNRERHPRVHLAYRWIEADGDREVVDEYRLPLEVRIRRQTAIYWQVGAYAPAMPGRYQLEFSLVFENDRRFGERHKFPVEVTVPRATYYINHRQVLPDDEWRAVRDFLLEHTDDDDAILAPSEYAGYFKGTHPYLVSHYTEPRNFRFVVLHKGRRDQIDEGFLREVVTTWVPVYGNMVFVVFDRDRGGAIREASSPAP